MACLNPLHIINPAKKVVLTPSGGFPMLLDVPCGQCSECAKAKHNEWLFRAYYQSQDCFDAGGYILFDTLTYAPHQLPRLGDIVDDIPSYLNYGCFNRHDIRAFLMRLRSRLLRRGYDVSDKLKYFLSSEYGTSDGGTHRPHYHLLLYVYDNTIPHLELSQLISDCWAKGRTDGVVYRGNAYVTNNCYFPASTGNIGIHRLVKYVTKYVQKDSEFEKQITHRILSICQHRNIDDKSYEGKQFIQSIKRYACQFHLQSHGFGAQFLKYNDYTTILQHGYITCPDNISTLQRLPLPMYMRRKLFYDVVRDFRGERVWQLNELGVAFKMARVDKQLTALSSRFVTWFQDLGQYVAPKYVDNVRSFVNELLDGRSFDDFSLYIAFYRGRLKDDYQSLIPPTLDTWLVHLYNPPYTSDYLVKYSTPSDVHHFGQPFLCTHYIGSPKYGCSNDLSQISASMHCNFGLMSLHKWIDDHVVNEHSFYAFRDFDKLYELYCLTLINNNRCKQSLFDYKQHITNLYKQLQNG